MLILTQFLFRLSFGLSLGMALTSPRQVSGGYFRNNLYVLLGIHSLAALLAWFPATGVGLPFWAPAAAAVMSYVGAALWLYEKHLAGIVAVAIVSALSGIAIASGILIEQTAASAPIHAWGVWWLGADALLGGLVLGWTMAAMLLGHWYLNSPGMKLEPLKKLVALLFVAIVLRVLFGAVDLWIDYQRHGGFEVLPAVFLALRWLLGILGAGLLAVMAWRTLEIPNTQSATGILYVATLAVFTGELAGQLLSQLRLDPV